MVEGDDYKFLKLRDAVTCLNQKVNFIGVILEFGFPRRSKGTDYFVSIKLIDESYPKPGITVNIYAEDLKKLPLVASPGDIAQLSHVVIKPSRNEIYGFYAQYVKKSSSFALYKGRDGEDFVPYQVSSKFSSRELDKKFIEYLRSWLVNFQLGADPNDYQFVKEIKLGQRINLVAKILHKCKVAQDQWIIFVWDGTDAPTGNIQTKLVDEMNNPLIRQLEPKPLPRDVLCTFPTVGTVFRVILEEGIKSCGLGFLQTGLWVNFVDIVCEDRDGLWRGVLLPVTKLRYMPKNDRYVLSCQRCYDDRLLSKSGRMSWWSFPSPSRVTVVDHVDEPLVSLMDVITHPKVIGKYKCVVRVVAVFPWPPEYFLSPHGVYRVRLTLEDATARIHAYLYDEDGDMFFDRLIPTDILRRRMNKLLGVHEDAKLKADEYSVRNPPWVHCCLKSYYLDKGDPWGTRQYRVFGTRLVAL